jgi:hypothetical protein
MSLTRKKKLLRKKNSWPSWPHMKKRRILNLTTLRIVKKKISNQPICRVLKTEGEIQATGIRA